MNVYGALPVKLPKRNVFNLSHSKRTTLNIGELFPSLCVEMVPGDYFEVAQNSIVELSPLIADFKGELTLDTYLLFISYNQLKMDDDDGSFSDILLSVNNPQEPVPIPKWTVTDSDADTGVGTLWDALGFPLNVNINSDAKNEEVAPIDYIRRAYNQGFNYYFRDEQYDEEVDLQSNVLQKIRYRKDRFTSAFDSPQRGVTPSMKLSGNASVQWEEQDLLDKLAGYISLQARFQTGDSGSPYYTYDADLIMNMNNIHNSPSVASFSIPGNQYFNSVTDLGVTENYFKRKVSGDSLNIGMIDHTDLMADTYSGASYHPDSTVYPRLTNTSALEKSQAFKVRFDQKFIELLNQNNIDLDSIVTFNIEDLRLLNKLQLWLEKNQLYGTRYKEYLLANYGIAPSDETLQEPAYVGGVHIPVVVSPVVSKSETSDAPLGTVGGRGVTMDKSYIGKYRAKEFGVLMAFSALRPKAAYSQGIDRQFIKNSVWDFFNPTFQSLGQEEILGAEIFVNGDQTDKDIIGYTGRYNEMRAMTDLVTGKLRATGADDLSVWTVQRKFANRPNLQSSEFLEVDGSDYNYLFSVQDEPQAVVSFKNVIKAVRPLSKFPMPSLGV